MSPISKMVKCKMAIKETVLAENLPGYSDGDANPNGHYRWHQGIEIEKLYQILMRSLAGSHSLSPSLTPDA
jgi:hypothetical protein